VDDSLELADRNVADLVVRVDVAVDARTGTASVSVPLPLTPGRGDLDPELALTYGSGGGNSPFGVGWSLAGVPAITLDPRDGVPRYDGDDGVAFAGERLVPWLERDGPRWVPRTATVGEFTVQFYRRAVEQDPRLRFERWIERSTGRCHWRIRDARDVVTVYGLAEDGLGRVADPDDPERVYAWLPESRHDPYGNAVAYVWVAEDVRGVDPRVPAERRHLGRAQPQRLLKRVRWGNVAPLAPGGPLPGADGWSVELVLDYGDHSGETPAADPDRAWPVRADPYSTCRPGFEVRTWRLCRRLLLYHRFAELGPGATLVWVTTLEHRADPAGSRLDQIVQTGVRRGGPLAGRRSLPPLRLGYTEPSVATRLEPLPAQALENAPGGLFGARAQLVDLRGEGLVGILTETADAWYYKPSEGGGSFGPQQRLADKPARPAGLVLGDFDRDGDTDLMGLRGRLPGAASFDRAAGAWEAFRPFRSAPRLDGAIAGVQWLDVDGDGRPEPLLRGAGRLVWYPPNGDGFGAPLQALQPGASDAAAPVQEAPQLGLLFADMNGDGLVDQVRVGNGRVEYWPNLGNGRFGEPVVMDGAPRLAPDGQFEPERLRLVDLDGRGTADLVYLGHGELAWWTNASGNRLVEGGRVTGLPYVDDLASVQVSDVLGDGLPSLLWSSPLPGQAEPVRYLPLTGGVRPGLLTEIDNSGGGRTLLTYASSASHYLRDVHTGRGWRTRLPSHVVVVERLEAVDEVRGTTGGSRYEYHDGFFDGDEQIFAGFALVDQYDLAGAGEDQDADAPARSCTRVWYHTGDPVWHRSLADASAGDADPGAAPLPAATIAELGELSSAEHADALRCLVGAQVRAEVYAVGDGAGGGDALAPHPFTVAQTRWQVRRLQPADPALGAGRAVLARHAAERLTHHYEQAPDDPRVTHWLALEVDEVGQVTLACDLAYARRPSAAATAADVTAQAAPVATITRSTMVNVDTPARHEVGIDIEEEQFELRLPGVATAPLAHDDLRGAVWTALLAPLAPHESFAPLAAAGPQARRTGWERTFYWNDAATAALPLGAVGERTLQHHQETACLTDQLVDDIFGDRVDAAATLPGLGYLAADGL
jgi:Salmonella virulence plasmid 65kDa B protein/Insecticide toxin TcdB middle/N-terminal region/Insecticide toxin TcdB middle/C-terminal region